ncbi:MAG: TRAP transporter substrate-binding protein [Amphritea sp.]
MRKSLIAAFLSTCVIAAPAFAAETIKLRVVGQPLATGLIQKNLEQPFFENLAKTTGLPLQVNYKPLDTTGIKDVEELRVLKSGLFDLASLRLSQVSRDEPTLLGLDLVGLSPNYKAGREVVDAYSEVVDKRLQERFNTKLLGVWPFGPQVLFCNDPIKSLEDVKGLKVRVYDQNLAKFVESIGGVPVPIGFGEVHQSLALGVVECAITGASSANSAGWPEVTTHVLPLGFQMGLNGYGINLKTWNKFSPDQQQKLEAAFDGLIDDIWAYSEELFNDAGRCNVGKIPCDTGTSFNLVEVPISDKDIKTVQSAVKEVSFPLWAELCDKTNSSCSADWKRTVGAQVGL